MFAFTALLLIAVAVCNVSAVANLEAHHDSHTWIKDFSKSLNRDEKVTFTVALKLQNEDLLHDEFLAVSSPKSERYGNFYSHESLQRKFGPSRKDRLKVAAYFMQMEGVEVRGIDEIGDFLTVTAPVHAIEKHLSTTLSLRMSRHDLVDKTAIRADTPLSIPSDVAEKMSFLSLNTPVAHMNPRAAKTLKNKKDSDAKKNSASTKTADSTTSVDVTSTIGLTVGNQQALVTFQPVCGDGSLNTANPPCSNMVDADDIPTFKIQMNQYAMNITSNPSQSTLKPLYTTMSLTTDPTRFMVASDSVFCASTITKSACVGGTTNATDCYCLVKISPVPMYIHVDFEVFYSFNSTTTMSLGTSNQQTLTDTATAQFLSNLYSIPSGLTVRYGSNQSVAEFYGEFYSNSDLLSFFQLSGLPAATIPNSNVLGDLPNNQQEPGGEAQLDVEYIMALAPGADTYFYSFSDLNPYNSINEGFLAYLTYVSQESYPPLVHSLSYGDVEADVFNASNIINGTSAASYGAACDQQFAKMGLRGLSVLFSR